MYLLRFALVLTVAVLQSVAGFAADTFSWKVDDAAATATLMLGEKPVVRYLFAYDTSTPEKLHDTYKVYHHVFGPGTDTIITKGPGGEFTHHRGLYVGWNKTSYEGGSGDWWHCTNGVHQRHVKIESQTADANHGAMTTEIHWNDKDGKPVIIEHRTIDVRKAPNETNLGYGWQIDWSTRLESQRGTIKLDGDRQHAGFQFRAASPVATAKSATYIRPANFPQEPKAIEVSDAKDPNGHINLGWFAMKFPLEEKEYLIEYLEDPKAPKPSRYSERPYGRFGAFYQAEITPEKPLVMNYRVFVSHGTGGDSSTVQAHYDQFAKDLAKDTK